MPDVTDNDDIRNTDPNQSNHRRARFKHGWQRAASERTYVPETLVRVTWESLGYRLGQVLGGCSDGLINEYYDLCVRQQAEAQNTQADA